MIMIMMLIIMIIIMIMIMIMMLMMMTIWYGVLHEVDQPEEERRVGSSNLEML